MENHSMGVKLWCCFGICFCMEKVLTCHSSGASYRLNQANLDREVIRTMAIPIQNKNLVRIASFSNSLTTITISYSFIIWFSDCDQATPHILVITTTR